MYHDPHDHTQTALKNQHEYSFKNPNFTKSREHVFIIMLTLNLLTDFCKKSPYHFSYLDKTTNQNIYSIWLWNLEKIMEYWNSIHEHCKINRTKPHHHHWTLAKHHQKTETSISIISLNYHLSSTTNPNSPLNYNHHQNTNPNIPSWCTTTETLKMTGC